MRSSENKPNRTAQHIDEAVKVLERGGIISFPTETYYGLGVNPFDHSAVKRLFQLKKRAQSKPILVLIPHIDMLPLLVATVPELYQPLIEEFWPGPLTLIFPARKTVDPLLTGNTGTIGIRISSNQVVNNILQKWGNPVTATSANISNHAPAQSYNEVMAYFGNKVDQIIDGGDSPAGLCSTIVTSHQGKLLEIRKGQIPFEMIDKVTKI